MEPTALRLFSLFLCVSIASTFSTHGEPSFYSLDQADGCNVSRIIQFIPNYQLPISDLEYFIANNMSQFSLEDVGKPKGVSFHNISALLSQNQSGKAVQQIQKLKWNVTNGFNMNITLQANVHHLGVTHHYTVTISSDRIPVNYTKSYSQETQHYTISETSVKIGIDNLRITKITPDEKNKDKITNLFESDLLTAVIKNFDSLNQGLNSNAKNSHFSQIYPTNIYDYEFMNQHFPIDVSTKYADFSTISPNTLFNQLVGSLLSSPNPKCPSQTQQFKQGYSQFISIEFMDNLAEAGKDKIQQWQNVAVNRKQVRSNYFQFRLIDLEYVVNEQAFIKYGNNYLNDISFTCALQQTAVSTIDEKEFVHVQGAWNCSGFLLGASKGQPIQILDMIIEVDHHVAIDISADGEIKVSVKQSQIGNVDFNQVDDIVVVNQELAKVYIKQISKSLNAKEIIGSKFRVKKGSSKIAYQMESEGGAGIWIG